MVPSGEVGLALIWRPALCALLFLLVASTVTVHGQPGPGQIGVTISKSSASIDMSLNLIENFTSLPSFNIQLNASNSQLVSQPMSAAMDKLVPSATIDSLQLTARTSLMNARTNTWLLQENYTLQVSGINKNIGSVIESDMSFLRMNVSQSINIQGFELNSLGAKYLLQPLENLRVQQLQQRILTTRYFLDTKIFTNTVVPGNGTLSFNILDFTWVLPLIGWGHQDQPLATTSTWLLPANIVTPYNLTVGFALVESQYIPLYEATYYASIQITAPPRATAVGNTIMFDIPAPAETAMPIIIAATLIAAVVTFMVDRKLTRPLRARKKRG